MLRDTMLHVQEITYTDRLLCLAFISIVGDHHVDFLSGAPTCEVRAVLGCFCFCRRELCFILAKTHFLHVRCVRAVLCITKMCAGGAACCDGIGVTRCRHYLRNCVRKGWSECVCVSAIRCLHQYLDAWNILRSS